MTTTIGKIAQATALAGILDIGAAAVLTVMKGGTPAKMLRGVASGPFPDAATMNGGAAVGLLTHFVLMAIMASVFFLVVLQLPLARARPLLAGAVYGFGIWCVMYLIVLPWRFPKLYPLTDPTSIAIAIFLHIVFVGLSMGWIARRG